VIGLPFVPIFLLQPGCIGTGTTSKSVEGGGSVRVGLRTETTPPVKLGDQIVVTVDVLNLMNSPSSLNRGVDDESTFVLDLFCNGAEVQRTAFGQECQADARVVNFQVDLSKGIVDFSFIGENLPPLATSRHRINVSKLFNINRSGDYVLVIRRNVNAEAGIIAGTSATFVVRE
jgi:hypothetical protein